MAWSLRKELTGRKFSRLFVEEFAFTKNHRAYWRCKCDCGNHKIVMGKSLLKGSAQSCGCYKMEQIRKSKTNFIHGMSGSPEWRSWASMKERCLNPKATGYKRYGARGIKICDRWKNSFKNFYDDMGPRPSGYSLDRINTNGNYEKSNCKWSSRLEQNRNKRSNIKYAFRGENLTLGEIAPLLNIDEDTLRSRIYEGWSFEEATTTPTLRTKNAK